MAEESGATFDPNRTKTSEIAMAAWVRTAVSDDITVVPGIAAGNAGKFASVGVHTQYQLFGVYLSLKGEGTSSIMVAESFFQWLKVSGIAHKRGEITQAVAEKLNNMFPGIYQPDCY